MYYQSCVYVYGLFIGYNFNNKKDVKVSIPNPIKEIKEKIENKKQDDKLKEQVEELNKIYYNIEHYNGNNEGQKEVKGIEIRL